MGLLSRLMGGSQPVMKASDEALLLHAMSLIGGADGVAEQKELITVQALVATLPEFKGKDMRALALECNKIAGRYPNYVESVKALAGIESEQVRKKCFILAVEVAMCSGDVDESEEKVLEAMQRVLNIDDAFASKALDVMSLKYVC